MEYISCFSLLFLPIVYHLPQNVHEETETVYHQFYKIELYASSCSLFLHVVHTPLNTRHRSGMTRKSEDRVAHNSVPNPNGGILRTGR